MNHDPIEDFFARERDGIEPLAGGEQRWQEIVGQARARRRPARHWLGYAAAVAAAATLAGTGGWLLRGSLPGGEANPAATGSSSSATEAKISVGPSASATASATQSSPASSSGQHSASTSATTKVNPTNLPVPQDFTLMSLSFAGADTMLALGSGTCSGPACPAVIKSTDNGATWNLVASLKGAESPGRSALSQVGSDRAFTGIRMASPQVGFIFGGGAMKTTDGGSRWEDYGHTGATVVDLATNKTDVVLTSVTQGCDGSQCSGDLLIERGGVEADATAQIQRIPLSVPIRAADVEFSQSGAAIVRVEPVTSEQRDWPGATYLVSGDQVSEIDLGCADTAGIYLASSGGKSDFSACPLSQDGQWSLAEAGMSAAAAPQWSDIEGTGPDLGPGVFASFAATDAQNLIAGSGGTGGQGALQVSHDGGRSWHEPAGPPPLPERGWRWVASPGSSWYYAIPTDAIRGFWRSTDNGETWNRVSLG